MNLNQYQPKLLELILAPPARARVSSAGGQLDAFTDGLFGISQRYSVDPITSSL
jgi:hypothetical protein